ncbi:tumor necrosis factor receptor superfamily member 18 [Zonotrichia albicollis]|uniref:tumor necrosis factor receptor superfamily member 18 n=1 Tax=Zonotrichia albicollis TaxID=44394 RepID=UPI003D80DBA9
MARALLWLLLAGHWAGLGRAGQCQDGELRVGWGGDTKCCPNCTWEAGNTKPCEKAKPDLDCQCPPGYGCSGNPCQYCRKLPQCPAGWELSRIGSQNSLFVCKPCENGTFSSTRNSWCRNWTDCGSRGLGTRRPGNATHDAECGAPAPAPEHKAPVAPEFPSSTILAILVAVAVFVLVLLTFLLHFCIWSLHRSPKLLLGAADSGPPFPRLPPRPAQGEESSSIQFPEEEHGDKSEEKLSVLSLKVYSELR